jgi:hypothetical protein
MVIEKSLDGVLVNPIDVQPRPAHPKRKHCKACHVYIDGARCVPALAQMMPESISVGRQLLVRRIAGKSSCRFILVSEVGRPPPDTGKTMSSSTVAYLVQNPAKPPFAGAQTLYTIYSSVLSIGVAMESFP